MAMFVLPSVSRLTLIVTATLLASACSALEEARPVQKNSVVVLQDQSGDLTSRVREGFLLGNTGKAADKSKTKDIEKKQVVATKIAGKAAEKQQPATVIENPTLTLEEAIERAEEDKNMRKHLEEKVLLKLEKIKLLN